jgi:hypothetical protein
MLIEQYRMLARNRTDVSWQIGMRELEEVGREEGLPLCKAGPTELTSAAPFLCLAFAQERLSASFDQLAFPSQHVEPDQHLLAARLPVPVEAEACTEASIRARPPLAGEPGVGLQRVAEVHEPDGLRQGGVTHPALGYAEGGHDEVCGLAQCVAS